MGYLYTDYFPVRWDDNWLIQLWAMASNGPQLFIDGRLDGQASCHYAMRDLRFWTEFYGHMKPYRQKEAARIGATALWPPVGLLDRRHRRREGSFLEGDRRRGAGAGRIDRNLRPVLTCIATNVLKG